jgi:hypothetical protein
MTKTTITVDETQNGQILFSPELNAFLQVSIVSTSTLQSLLQQQQAIVANAQVQISALNASLLQAVQVTPP